MTNRDIDITEVTIPKEVVRLMDESFRSVDKERFEECFEHYLSLIVPKDVLTGKTGASKSIIMAAINLILGKRSKKLLQSRIVHDYWKFIVIYERYLSKKSEKRSVVYSTRNRNKLKDLLKQHDYLKAVTILLEGMVIKKGFTDGFKDLMDNGYKKNTGEWLVKENPEHFSAEAVEAAKNKLDNYKPVK